MSLHSELIAEARKRVRPHNPSQGALRRAVSDSYYSLFHAIGAEVARPYPAAVQAGAKRMLDHAKAKSMANKIKGQKFLPAASPTTACPALLLPIASNFCELQEARHIADYDERIRHSKNEVIALIDRSESSIATLKAARAQCPDELYAFVLSLLFDRWHK
jgi:uncharacterized protein (UPF0332 family)